MSIKGREPVFFFFDVEAASGSVGADIVQIGITCDPRVNEMAEFSELVKTKQKLSSFSKFFLSCQISMRPMRSQTGAIFVIILV